MKESYIKKVDINKLDVFLETDDFTDDFTLEDLHHFTTAKKDRISTLINTNHQQESLKTSSSRQFFNKPPVKLNFDFPVIRPDRKKIKATHSSVYPIQQNVQPNQASHNSIIEM